MNTAPATASTSATVYTTFPLRYRSFERPPRRAHEFPNNAHWRSTPGGVVFDNLGALREAVALANENNAAINLVAVLNDFRISEGKITLSLIGPSSCEREMHDTRMSVLRAYGDIACGIVPLAAHVHRHCFANGQPSPQLLDFVHNVALFNKCSIFISPTDLGDFEISVFGYVDQVAVTENKLRLFLDDANPQNYSDFLELESLSLLPLLQGPEGSVIRKIALQTNCAVYTPNLLPSLYYNNSLSNETGKPKIFITGLRSMVLLAKNLLSQILNKVSVSPFVKQVNVMPTKREMLAAADHEALNALMESSGCYLSIPPLGSPESSAAGDIVSFQGNSIEDVEILVDSFMDRLSLLYCTKIDAIVAAPLGDVNKILNLMDSLCSASNSFVSLVQSDDKLQFQILGDSPNTKLAINYLNQNLPPLKSVCVQYQIELLNKEKDFISGKKNGKIIKIINMSNSTIKLLPLNENNFVVELKCNDLVDSILGLSLLEDELPKMLTFNVPESFHRQIIGVGGQTIQAIMRRFNVFVKFSNSFELTDKSLDYENAPKSTNFQQSFIRKNNVVIKCPSKNKAQIPLAKVELEKLVEKVTKNNYSCTTLTLNNPQWRLMTSFEFNALFNVNRKKSTNFITELEKKTNTYIKYPALDSVDNSSPVKLEIFGIENNSKFCSTEILKIVPYCYQFKLAPPNALFGELRNLHNINLTKIDLTPVQLSFLNNLVVPLRLLYNVELECTEVNGAHALRLYYYPHAFGYNYIVNNANADIQSVERLSREAELEVVRNQTFSQVIQGVNKLLLDWQFGVVDSGVVDTDVGVSDVRLRMANGNGSDEKLNLSSNNSRSNTNLARKFKQKPPTQNQTQPQQGVSRVGSSLNSSEETLSSAPPEKSKIFTSITLPPKSAPPLSMPSMSFGQPAPLPTDLFHTGFLPSSLTTAMDLNSINFHSDVQFPSQFHYGSSNDKIWQ